MDGLAGEGLAEPLPRPLERLLRRATLDHALSERRRWFTPALHVGTPGGRQAVLALEPVERLDHALRCDAVAALRHRAAPEREQEPLAWLTRPGDLALQDLDAQWLAAALAACAEAEIALTMVVVNRHGWRDPRSGVGRAWRRLRPS